MNTISMLAEQERHHSALMKVVFAQLENERAKLKIATEGLEQVSGMAPYSLSTLSEVQSVAAKAIARIKGVG